MFSAFLDAIDVITLLVGKTEKTEDNFLLSYMNKPYNLEVLNVSEEHEWFKITLKNPIILNMNIKSYVINGNNRCVINSGSFVRDPRFDEHYSYSGPLGVEYHKEYSIFRIWSPVAKDIVLELTLANGNLITPHLISKELGLWELKVDGDLEKAKYRYRVLVFLEYQICNDPYGISSNANANFNYVVDENKFRKFNYSKPYFSGRYTDAIIYEASVRDLTSKLDVPNKMQFKALTQKLISPHGHSAGLDYMAALGITHLQLLPVFDFYGISDKNPSRYYNWGYNPIQYFVPKGAYSSNPDDPYARINELIELIDYCHAYGILVNMDVVFNHVNNMQKFPFDILCPGYYYRMDHGYPTNVSGCGNDLATERFMTSRFIVDNLLYFQRTYHISGFRFDLMGLLDIDTLQAVSEKLRANDPNVMLYGEGWDMPNTLDTAKRPTYLNYAKIPDYAFFNDQYRDFMKGNQWDKTNGFLFNETGSLYDFYHLITGSCLDNFRFNKPSQSINYIECHDNYTLYDFIRVSNKKAKERDVYSACKLGLAITILSIGIPFLHCGQEFMRSKAGVENSYNAGDLVNGIDWEKKDTYRNLVQTTRDLIRIRKTYKIFCSNDPEEISKSIKYMPNYSSDNITIFRVMDGETELYLIVKDKKGRFEIKLQNYTLIFDGSKICNIEGKKIVVRDKGIYLLRRDG